MERREDKVKLAGVNGARNIKTMAQEGDNENDGKKEEEEGGGRGAK